MPNGKFISLAGKIGLQFIDLLLPRACAGCGASNESFCPECRERAYKKGAVCAVCGFRNSTGDFCGACRRSKLLRDAGIPAALKSVLWAGKYENILKNAVMEMKYKKRRELAEPLGMMLRKKFAEMHTTADPLQFTVVPIPLHPSKKSERGFNQAEELAVKFSKYSGINMRSDILQRIKETKPQALTKEKSMRLQNLEGAFFADSKKITALGMETRTIILIDDVATTGATLIHAARALEEAGAAEIIGLVAAHG